MKASKQEKWLDESGENLGILRRLEGNAMLLAMESGGFSKEDLWFLQDEQGEEYVVFPQKIFVQLLSHIKNIQEEKLVMRLEKDALESLRLNDGNLPDINTNTLAKDIKKKYPNLFFDIDYLRKSK